MTDKFTAPTPHTPASPLETPLFRADMLSVNSQLIDQMNSLKVELSSLRTINFLRTNDVRELRSVLTAVYDNQNVHNYPAELRDRMVSVLIETKLD